MAARGPRTRLSALRALFALAVVLLVLVGIVFFGTTVADFVSDQFGDDSNQEPDDGTENSDQTADGTTRTTPDNDTQEDPPDES